MQKPTEKPLKETRNSVASHGLFFLPLKVTGILSRLPSGAKLQFATCTTKITAYKQLPSTQFLGGSIVETVGLKPIPRRWGLGLKLISIMVIFHAHTK